MAAVTDTITWQPSLFEAAAAHVDRDLSFAGCERIALDARAWVDVVRGWLHHPGELFEWLLANASWHTGEIVIHGKRMVQPRMLAGWSLADPERPMPAVIERMRAALSARYDRLFDSVGVNLYRDGRDSVAWHGDRIPREVIDPMVAIVTLGEPRRLLLRPAGGHTAHTLAPQPGDLVVMGGASQRTWQHSIPKVATAGPRISVTLRHATNDPLG